MYEKESESIKKYLRENLQVEKSLMLDGKNLRSQRRLQHVFFKRFTDSSTQKLFEIVLMHAEKVERTCPGSGIQLLKRYANLHDTTISSRPYSLNDLKKYISDRNFSSMTQHMLLECLKYCKPTSKINIKKSINQKAYLEISNRYNFAVESLLNNKSVNGIHAKVIVIDGYVENVAELHHIFQHFSTKEQTTPFLIFCRGMSDDVLSTISTNNQRSAFNCHPFKVNFDLDSVNTLVDIAIVSGCDVVSSLKGELISSIPLDNLKKVDYFSRTSQGISIKNFNTVESVKLHVNRIRRKIDEAPEEGKKYLFQRIKSLSANSIDIAIPDDINFFSRSQELDEGIRILISYINKGPDTETLVQEFQKKLSDVIDNIADIIN